MAQKLIEIGAVPNDGTGTPAREAGEIINDNFAELYDGVPHVRLDLSASSLTASFRDDGSGNLGWYVGAAGAADGSQVKAATVDKTTGAITSTRKVTLGVTSGVGGNSPDFRLLTADGRGWRIGTASTGTTHDYFYIQGTIDGFVSSFIGGLSITPSGNVGIGAAPAAKLDVSGGNIRCTGSASSYSQLSGGNADGASMILVRGGGSNIAAFSQYQGALYVKNLDTGSIIFTTTSGDTERLRITNAGNVLTGADNSQTLGGASNRWSVVYAGTGTINTSDAREKTPVRGFDPSEIAAARELLAEIGIYQFLAAIEEKGEDGARLHVGMTVQRAIEIMEGHGLDPWRYGFICRDEITRKVNVVQTVIEQATEEVDEAFSEIEIRDGVPVQVQKTRAVQRLRFEMVAVVDEAGQPVMQEVQPDGLGFGGIPERKPVLHPVPVMAEVEREVEIDEPAGERLGFRPDQLAFFLLAGLAAEA